jgi:energy-coupling factor transporter transmembrane protein EcfT
MLAAELALSLAPRTLATVAEVREAQRIRGASGARWRVLPALVVPVLETGMEEAVTLAESMDARGHGRGPRTRYRNVAWGFRSWVTAGASIAVAGAFGWSAFGGVGELQVAMSPLQWPRASFAMVAVSALLAMPALLPGRGPSQ